jgi:hypothetical protein
VNDTPSDADRDPAQDDDGNVVPFPTQPLPSNLPVLWVPYRNAPFLTTLGPLDEVLCAAPGPEPPFRSLTGRYALVQEQRPAIMHRLTTSEKVDKENWLPVPPVVSIVEVDTVTLLTNLEGYVTYLQMVKDKTGKTEAIPGRLPVEFAHAYASWVGSKLPRVEAVLTLPMVRNGALITANGLDPKLQAIFRVEPRLMEKLPTGPVPVETAKASYEWLVTELLKDVNFKDPVRDAAKALAIPLSIIQRGLFDKRPQFLCTGDVPGVGKTTLINMLVGVATGHEAAAMAWSDDPEERKKAVFAVAMAGVPCVVFDNIERGATINCPHLNRMSTSVEISDRVLGLSRHAVVAAKTVVIYNGNAIGVKGDAAGRTLYIVLESVDRRPSSRAFARERPENWAIERRAEILPHLYNVLMVEREEPQWAKTRFKAWWRLVGHPLEIVSGVDFTQEVEDDPDLDEETAAKTRVIERLLVAFPAQTDLAGESKPRQFTAKDVANLLPNEQTPRDEYDAAADLAADLRMLVKGRDFAANADGVGRVLKSYVTGWVGLTGGGEARLEKVMDGKRTCYWVRVKP